MAILLVVAWVFSLLSVPVRCADPALNVPACSSQFNSEWAFNSKGQSPCQVAGYLGSVCSASNTFTIQSITPTEEYVLTSVLANNCTCSTVYYSALSACAVCQGGGNLPWNQWGSNCSTVFSIYPFPIPDGTAVPHWAFQSYTSDPASTFNASLAQLTGDVPESSPPPVPSSTGSGAPAATSSSTNSDDKGKSEAGAIAGGVVGGLAFITISVILVLLFLRRRRRKAKARRERQAIDDDDAAITTPTPFMIDNSPSPPIRVYNPSDPNTFPSTPMTTERTNTTSPGTFSTLSPMSHYRSLSDTTTGHYTGAAEI